VAVRLDRWPVVLSAFTALAIVMTWPLVTELGTHIAWDLGDPVFNCWIILWTGGQVLKALHGDFNALHDYWNGNIFYPERLTIAYSEHYTPQMLQSLPLLAATGNVVLCYNVLYISTIVLSGWGMYLLVRELTGRPLAAFVAGLAFAFAPYRISQGPHLQELSSQWMPFVLYGFRRYFVSLRTRPLVGASAALAVQNLSCGYYLLFFTPFAAAYCLYEMADRRLLRNRRVWTMLVVAAVAVVAVTWPFVSPYLKLRRHNGVGVRSYEEAVQFSADVYALGTASSNSRLEGTAIRAFPKGEGEGFPGFAILGLSGLAVIVGASRARAPARRARGRRWQEIATWIIGVALALDVIVLLYLLVAGSLPFLSHGRPYHNTAPLLAGAGILAVFLLAIAPAARQCVRGIAGSTLGFYASATLAATLLALGPRILSAGRPVGTGPYYWLYAFVPGFNGIRVPARYLMLVACFLAVLAGLGAVTLLARLTKRVAVAVLAAASLAILAESWVAPLPTNNRLISRGLELTPRELFTAREMGPLYQFIRDDPDPVVLIEFPFGDSAYDILATYYAGFHRRPLVNGYSGFFPETYLRRVTFLDHIPFDLETATKAVQSSGATHAIVHEAAFPDGRGHEITDWLTSTGGKVLATYGADKLIQLR